MPRFSFPWSVIALLLAGLMVFEILLISRRKQGILFESAAASILCVLLILLSWPDKPGQMHPLLYASALIIPPILAMVGFNEILGRMKPGLTPHLALTLFVCLLLLGWGLVSMLLGCMYYSDC